MNDSDMKQTTDATKSPPARDGSESPTSKCPICLSLIDNPAFTDICIHQFCFTCLCEWAKVKAVCPVCKQDFQTIAYNVISYEKFDELSVKELIVADTCARFQNNHTGFQISAILSRRVSQINGHPQDARFRYRTTMTSDYRDVLRRLEEQRTSEELRNPLVRIAVNHRPFVFSSNARKAVYRTGLRVQHLQTATEQVFSVINPQFFNDNPACKIRLSPWLQRELDVMAELGDIPIIGDTMLLINLIFSLLNTLKITSQNFYNKLYPYLRRHTLHFLQELYCFARSAPYTVPQYDSCVVYGDGTSGAIWSVWHRDKAHSNSSISTAIHVTDREDIIQIPSDTGFISFVMKKHGRNVIQSSVTPVQGTSGVRASPDGPIDLVQGLSDSSSDIEVVDQEPPWNARRPIVVSDSDEETVGREQMVDSWVDRDVKYPVSETLKEHQDQRTSRDSSQTSLSSVSEQRYHPEDSRMPLHNGYRRKRENERADVSRDISSERSVEENAGHRLKAKHRQNSSDDGQSHYSRGSSQNHAKKLENKDGKSDMSSSRGSSSREEHSHHSKYLRKLTESSSKEQSTSIRGRTQYEHRSTDRSRSYQRRHSNERSRTHRKSDSKERRGTSSNIAREQPKVKSRSKESDCIYSRRQHTEHRERGAGTRKPSSCSSELPSGSLEKLDGDFKERQLFQHTKSKRLNSRKTSRCDSSDVDVCKLSSNGTIFCEQSCVSVSSATCSLSSSVSVRNLSSGYGCLTSCSRNLVGEDVEEDRKRRLQTDSFTGYSSSRSYNENNSDIFPSNVCGQGLNGSSKLARENNDLNDCHFVRKTYFWSDEEENSKDSEPSRSSKTLKSQIGCMLVAGDCETPSVLKPLSADEEFIIVESSDCSSSGQHCLSKDYDTNETSCIHESKKRKHWSRSFMTSKKSGKECEEEMRNVSRDSSMKAGSCSRESRQSKKHKRSKSQTDYKKHRKERCDEDKDSKQIKTNHIKSDMDVGLSINKFDENTDQHKVTEVADDVMSHNEPLDVKLTFKKHFTGHKNLKVTKC